MERVYGEYIKFKEDTSVEERILSIPEAIQILIEDMKKYIPLDKVDPDSIHIIVTAGTIGFKVTVRE